MNAVMCSLEMYVRNYLGKVPHLPESTNDSISRYTAYTIKRLSLDLRNKIFIEEIAKELQVSHSYLTRKFKDETGVSPQGYLLSLRVKKVQQLLADTTMDIATISQEAGFSSQSHMTRNFTEQAGISPSKYRQHLNDSKGIFKYK